MSARSSSISVSVGFDSVVARYPGADRNAVDGVSLQVPAGSFTVFLGPSGCGKSTLLRTVNRLAVPTEGTVTIGNRDVASFVPTALRRSIGYVIQAVGLFAHMTVAQNIAVVPELLHWERERVAHRVDELLQLVGLDASRYRARYPRELSGGEAQRVGVARAIAAEPQVLLMDEPFGAVDALARRSLQGEMLRIVRTLQTTILFVTHDVEEALHLADRIAVMRDGKLVQYATPEEMLGAPAGEYVAKLFAVNSDLRRYDALRTKMDAG